MKRVALFNGTANAIETALVKYLGSKEFSLIRLIGLGTDGAKVMTGRISGAGTRLKRRQPMLMSSHCVCHRLALAASQAGKDVSFIDKKFKPTLSQLFLSK